MNDLQNASRLRFAASNFLALQGLRQVALGGMLLLLIPALWWLDYPWNLGMFVLFLICLRVVDWRIGVYYERRFGRVESRARPAWSSANFLSWRGLVWIALLLASLVAMKLPNLNLLSPGWFMGMLFVWFFALENRRWYYLACAAPFFVLEFLNRLPQNTLLLAEIWILPFAFILTGILDHLLLVRLLPGVRPNGPA